MSVVSPTATQSSNPALQNYLNQQAQTIAVSNAAKESANGGNGTNTLQGVTGSFDTFLKILTTQLKYQDPTNATDTNQFTQELVQFAGVEQQLNTNSNLQTLINLQKSSTGLTATLGYIGKYVEVPSTSQLPLQNKQAELAYTLPGGVSKVSVAVQDSSGKMVATLTGPITAGLDRVAWDGKDSNGNQLPDGTYTFKFSATGPDGSAIMVSDLRAVGLVTALQSNSDGTINLILSSGMTTTSSNINAVYDPNNLPKGTLGDGTSSSL